MSSASSSSASSSAERWVCHKFGGTSLATAECYANSAEIVRSLPLEERGSEGESLSLRKCLVVSAMGEVKGATSLVAQLIRQRSPGKEPQPKEKVTNLLIRATDLAAKRNPEYKNIVQQLRERHEEVVAELLASDAASAADAGVDDPAPSLRSSVLAALASDFEDFSHLLRAVWLSRSAYDADHAHWYGYGEIWSARLMQAYLTLLDAREHAAATKAGGVLPPRQDALFVDAREIITLTATHKDPTPDYSLSESKLHAWFSSLPAEQRQARIIVVTGYIASTAAGTPTTLGRDGSDYSASIMAALLHARHVTIWTDVDGVFSANPAAVHSAVILPHLSYDEASELAYFGAKVLHPKTMTPVVMKGIPVWIRNTFNAAHPGTCIVSAGELADRERKDATSATAAATAAAPVEFGVRGFSEISSLSLLLLEGTGMVGVSGVCARLFGVLKEAGVNVVLITQAGSEHSICLAVPRAHGEMAAGVIRKEFRDELSQGEISTVGVRSDVSCLAIVGDGMRCRRGAAARMFVALAAAGINIVAIAQGSSERNISVVMEEKDSQKGLRAVHEAFIGAEKGSSKDGTAASASSSSANAAASSFSSAAASAASPVSSPAAASPAPSAAAASAPASSSLASVSAQQLQPYVSDPRIRPAIQSDWDSLWSLWREESAADAATASESARFLAHSRDGEQARLQWWAQQSAGADTVLLVSEEGTVLGAARMGASSPLTGGVASRVGSASIKLSPSAAASSEQGRQRSVDVLRSLGAFVLSEQRKRGLLALVLSDVVESDTEAIETWQSLGLRIVGTVPEAFHAPTHGLVGLHTMHIKL